MCLSGILGGGPAHDGFSETFEQTLRVRHPLAEFLLAGFELVHSVFLSIHACGDIPLAVQDQTGQCNSNAKHGKKISSVFPAS